MLAACKVSVRNSRITIPLGLLYRGRVTAGAAIEV